MSNFDFEDCWRRRRIGLLPIGLNGVFTLDAVRSGAPKGAVR